MNSKNNLSTKTKYKLQTTGIKLGVLVIGVIVVMCVIAPYIHIFLDKKDTVKVFGFRNLKTFLYSFGMPLSLFGCSSLLFYSVKDHKERFKKVCLQSASFLFLWSSFFQLIWVFWSGKDLSKSMYYVSMILLSISTSAIYTVFVLKRESTINSITSKYKSVVLMLNTYIYDSEQDLKEEVKHKHAIKRGELVEKVLDNVG